MTPSQVSNGVSLRDLLTDAVRVGSGHDVRATSCTHDWRQVRHGDVHVALSDVDSDGHDSATQAVERGAIAVICERQLPVFAVPQFIVHDSRVAYGRLCQALVGNPSQQMKVIGVTGTSGKTTVSRLLTSIFGEAGYQAGTLDSFGYWDGYEDRPACREPLTPPVLAKSLAQMAAGGVSHTMLEISSRELSQAVLAGVDLDAVCLTNIGRDHLDWHATIENYRQAKRRIFDHLLAEGIAILNADDPVSVGMLCDVSQPVLTIGLKQPAEITAEMIEQRANEQTFVLTAGDESVGVRTTMIGDHHVYNCLSAAAACLAYGIDLTAIARGLEAVDRLPGRMELVRCGQEFTVFIDAARSPDTLRAALRAARQVTRGRLICVFGSPLESKHTTHPILGRVLGVMADVAVITTCTNTSRESCWELSRGLVDSRKAEIIPNRAEAIRWALSEARAGDTVVLAGLGDHSYRLTDTDGMPLDDRTTAEQLLRGTYDAVTPYRAAA
ncbi:MAG: UDP-N-acetylmuramyl-tripeptide synthetase, partial [Planctomycetes bacterium]|nr:UDP-N-acetylmuramyl-tripeptide synthetase [Planctomycetota bacterium]